MALADLSQADYFAQNPNAGFGDWLNYSQGKPTDALHNQSIDPSAVLGNSGSNTGKWSWDEANSQWTPYYWQQPQSSSGGFLHSGLDWHNDIAPGVAFVGGTLGAAALGGGLLGDTAGGAAGGVTEGGAASGAAGGAAGGAVDAGVGAAGGVGTAAITPAATAGIGGGDTGVLAGLGGGGAGGSAGTGALEGAGSSGVIAGEGATVVGDASGGAGTALSRIMDGTASTADWLSVGGNLASTGLGIAGSRNAANSYNNLAREYMAFGAPSRARYEASMAPGFDPNSIPGYSGAVDTASKGILARLAATGGNPWGNPGGLIEANKQIISGTALPAIDAYQRLNAGTGGYAGFNAAAPGAATAGISAQGGVYNAVGSGLAGLTNPQPSIYDTLARLGVQGLS